MQLDADEDGEPFFKPPAILPAPIRQRDEHQSSDEQQQPGDGSQRGVEGETEQAAAATATIEQEE